MSRDWTKEEFDIKDATTLTFTCKDFKVIIKPKLLEWYWNANVSGWRLYGVWIKRKYWMGFAIVKQEDESCQK